MFAPADPTVKEKARWAAQTAGQRSQGAVAVAAVAAAAAAFVGVAASFLAADAGVVAIAAPACRSTSGSAR